MKNSQKSLSKKMLKMLLMAQMFLAGSVSAYTITTDESTFFLQFSAPSEIIDFETLKDGTTFENVTATNPYWNGVSIGGELEIFEDGWSDNYLIRSVYSSPPAGHVWTATMWDGSSITPSAPYLSIYSNNDASPIVLYTTSGFFGVIPDDQNDKDYIFTEIVGSSTRVLEMQAGFSAVPLPATLWLFGSGFAGLMVVLRRKFEGRYI